jgi:glucose/arabinose dehydrogenase
VRSLVLLAGVLAWMASSGVGHAATLPPGFAESQVTPFLAAPTAMTFTPDGRLLVCEQGGRLRVIKDGGLLTTPFVALPVDFQGERGLLGVAVDADFEVNQFVYVYYTATTPVTHNRVSRFTASGDVAIPGSETVILELDPLGSAIQHNGGAIHFGADGKLYVAVGDNTNSGHSQSLSSRFGKMLRLNPDGSIPTDNPFFATASGPNQAIWALGLRNPFNFAVQPGTGRLFVNDVGESAWEEINDGIAGSNYGWPVTEGPTTNPAFRGPLHAYSHADGCAITGGSFYNPPNVQFPGNYVGDYFFADFCAGWIRHFDPATGAVTGFATGIDAPVDVKVGPDGSLYYVSIATGSLYRIQFTGSQTPSIGTQPTNQTASVGGSATFTVGASGTQPLFYQWQRDFVDIPGATAASYTLSPVSAADSGASFRVFVSNGAGTIMSNAVTLTVIASGAPTATITAPAAGTLYSAGDTISYAGTGTDPEQGALPASAFTWTVVFHHDTHTHPFLPATSGATGGSVVIPTTGETATNVWYRIHLTVTDSSGLSHSSFLDVRPRIVTLGLATRPPGLQVTLDGQPRATPGSIPSVVGMMRTLGVVPLQRVDDVTYEFVSWSDGGAADHTIATPGQDASFTATFGPSSGFADVSAGHWAKPWILALARAGVTGGCAVDPARFCPELAVTREQMAVLLLKAAMGPLYEPPRCTTAPFADVPCTSPFAAWIADLARRGITAGCGGGQYCPGASVTREQMAVFLLKTREAPGFSPAGCPAPTFADVPCSSAFAAWVYELLARGITAGCTPQQYCPGSPITRAQMAVFLVKTFGLPVPE